MLILAFDTATDVATSALVDDDEVLGERTSRPATLLEDVDALPPARACVQLEHLGPETRRVIVAADEDALLQEVAGAHPGIRHRD